MRAQARISTRSPRYDHWLKIYGTDTVAIESPLPCRGSFPVPGLLDVLIYKVHIPSLTPEQRRRMVEHVAEKSAIDPAEVERLLDDPEHGCPILAEDVFVIVDMRMLT